MKYLKITTILFASIVLSLSFISCKQQTSSSEQTKEEHIKDKTGPEYTSAYICPMHCKGSGSDKMDKCPVCGMDYIKNMDHEMHQGSHEGHNHGDDMENHMYACSMHPEITGNEGDNCSKCGMALTHIEGDDHQEHDHEDHSGHNH